MHKYVLLVCVLGAIGFVYLISILGANWFVLSVCVFGALSLCYQFCTQFVLRAISLVEP